MTDDALTGGCLCGAIRYRITGGSDLHYYCHCSDCRRHGGGPFHAGMVVAAPALTITGEPRVWTVTADSGRELARHFCATCGGHLFTSPWPEATRYSVKPGTLDNPAFFDPKVEIWTRSRVAWARIPDDLQAFEAGRPAPPDVGDG